MENLLAVGILSFVLLALVGLASTIITSKATTNKRVTAITLAQDKIEDIRRAGYAEAFKAAPKVTEGYNNIPKFFLFKRITETQIGIPAGMITVTVTVYWSADAQKVTLTTLLAP